MIMRLDIDKNLLREAMELGGHETIGAAVNEALVEYMRLRRSPLACDPSFGKDWDNPSDADYDAYQDHK